MNNASFVRELDSPVDRVWALLDDFPRLDWLPKEHKLEVVGSGSPGTVRIITMEGAQPVWEVLLAKDAAKKSLSYAVPVGLPVPVSNYTATMRVEPLGEGRTRLHWHSTWFADDGRPTEDATSEFIRIYNVLADGIEAVLQEHK